MPEVGEAGVRRGALGKLRQAANRIPAVEEYDAASEEDAHKLFDHITRPVRRDDHLPSSR